MITIKTNAKDLARLLQHANTKAVRQATARSLTRAGERRLLRGARCGPLPGPVTQISMGPIGCRWL